MSQASKPRWRVVEGIVLALLVQVGSLVVTDWIGRQRSGCGGHKTASLNRLRNLAVGLMNYHDQHRRLPTSAVYSQDGRPLLSWRVTVLPYIEEEEL
jgi:hypothetical protein